MFLLLLCFCAIARVVAGINWEVPGISEWVGYMQDAHNLTSVMNIPNLGPENLRFQALVGSVQDRNAYGDGLSLCVDYENGGRQCCNLERRVGGGSFHYCDISTELYQLPQTYYITALKPRHGHKANAACWAGFSIAMQGTNYTVAFSGSMLAGFGFEWQYNRMPFARRETVCAWMVRGRPGWVEGMTIYDIASENAHLNQGDLAKAEKNVMLVRSGIKDQAWNVSVVVDSKTFKLAVEHPGYEGYPLLAEDRWSLYLSGVNKVLKPCTGTGGESHECFNVALDGQSLEISRHGRVERIYQIVNVSTLQTNRASSLLNEAYMGLFSALMFIALRIYV